MPNVDYGDFNPSASTAALGEGLFKMQSDLAELFDKNKDANGNLTHDGLDIEHLRKQNSAIAEHKKKYDAALEVDRMAFEARKGAESLSKFSNPMGRQQVQPGAGDGRVQVKTVGDVIRANRKGLDSYVSGTLRLGEISRVNARLGSVDIDGVKTLMTLSDIAPQADRQSGYMKSPQYLSDVTPLFLQGTTDRNNVEFELESTYTSNAAEVAEGTANTDSALSFTNTSFPVRDINAWIPVGRQTLNDNSGLMSYIQSRLLHMLDVRRSAELMVGNGSGSNITGVASFSGIQSQARGTDDNTDAIFKAITLVRTTGDAEPSALVIHAQNWQTIRLLRTDNGLYIWGNPSDPGPDTVFGLQVKVSNSVTQNTGIVGAFDTYAQVFYNGGTVVEVSTEHSTYFTERKAAILASQQIALANYRGTAFCKITSMA